MMASKVVLRWVVQILLISVFTTMLLMVYLGHTQPEDDVQDMVKKRKLELSEELRTKRLADLQKTIFKNLKRPPDSTYNINVTLAESIPLDRDIPDSRPKQCASVQYDVTKLPTVSVIIPFYNEALSMLLRTVHSILKRTPPNLLMDIILVNDNSLNEDLHEPLEKYVRLLPAKVKLVRTQKREGLIRARLIGARMARGEVLMFQDAHTEVNVMWAEPILYTIGRNPKIIVQPEVDQIEAMTIEYIGATGTVPRGGFSWDLR